MRGHLPYRVMCGGAVPESHRTATCHECSIRVDRNVGAGVNILARGLDMGAEDRTALARGLWFGPDGAADEAMAAEPAFEVIRKADATRCMLAAGIPSSAGDCHAERQSRTRACIYGGLLLRLTPAEIQGAQISKFDLIPT